MADIMLYIGSPISKELLSPEIIARLMKESHSLAEWDRALAESRPAEIRAKYRRQDFDDDYDMELERPSQRNTANNMRVQNRERANPWHDPSTSLDAWYREQWDHFTAWSWKNRDMREGLSAEKAQMRHPEHSTPEEPRWRDLTPVQVIAQFRAAKQDLRNTDFHHPLRRRAPRG